MRFNRTSLLASFVLMATVSLTACGMEGVNGSVNVPAGTSRENAKTVNGGVHVRENAKVGKAVTVNGSVTLDSNAIAGEVKTVNGGIRIGTNSRIRDDVKTVNGGIHLAAGSDVAGDVVNVNGRIAMEGAHIGGSIRTVNADIDVGRGSHVEQGIHMQGNHGGFEYHEHIPRIVIGPASTVGGTLRFDREVELYVSDSATIGPVEGAKPIRFAGETPENTRSASAGGVERE